tara:strand:+ start:113 stop:763 length:651 start_codon:yes stop_codon:yes gene_type:complete
MFQYVESVPVRYVDPNGLQIAIPHGEDIDVIDTIEEAGELLTEFLDPPDWKNPDPIPFPIGPNDLVGGGNVAISVVVDFITATGTDGTACNRLFRRWFGGSACAMATCNKAFCGGFLTSAGPATVFNDCIDAVVGKDDATRARLRPLIRDHFTSVAGKLQQQCRQNSRNGPCCKNGRKKPPSDCPFAFPPPDQKPVDVCKKLRGKCPNPPGPNTGM